jgi:NhaP-type Na+/H+ or K+/H+ antiporter
MNCLESFLCTNIAHAAGVIEDATPIAEVLTNALQFLLSIAGILGILSLAVSGVLYMTAVGDESRVAMAKKAALFSVMGIAVILASLVIVTQIAKFF